MGMLDDIMKTLERIPGWKRISGLPAEVDALVARVAVLEAAQSAKLIGPACPACGEGTLMRAGSKPDPLFGDMGVMSDSFLCTACGHQENRQRDARQ